MKKTISAALCLMLILCGCSSRGNSSSADNIIIVDAGGASISDGSQGSAAITSGAVTTARTSASRTVSTLRQATAEPCETAEPIEPPPTEEPPNTASEPESTTVTSSVTTTAKSTATTAYTTTPATAFSAETTATTTESSSENPIVTPPVIGSNSYRALNYSEVKAVWISYIELADLLTGQSGEGFRRNIGAAFDNCVSLGVNTVYIHARSHSDAYYKSELFPWSKYVTGTLNCAPAFDPLEIMTDEAHARGISIHAWINPLRACAVSQISDYGDFPVKGWVNSPAAAGKYVVDVGGTYYLNPAYSPVIDLIAQGAGEIAANYDVDGVHIDDYFYPTTDASFDSSAFATCGYETLSEFRLANCDKLVAAIYSAVKAANSTALFGVSCQGSIENNYNLMYADVKKWCGNAGYLDYIAPQIYYGFANSAQPYKQCLSQWNDIAKAGGVPLIAGLSVSKIGNEDKWAGEGRYEWINDKDIISRQISAAMECTAFGGTALYSYRSIFLPETAVQAQVAAEMAAVKRIYKE